MSQNRRFNFMVIGPVFALVVIAIECLLLTYLLPLWLVIVIGWVSAATPLGILIGRLLRFGEESAD